MIPEIKSGACRMCNTQTATTARLPDGIDPDEVIVPDGSYLQRWDGEKWSDYIRPTTVELLDEAAVFMDAGMDCILLARKRLEEL